MNSHYIVDVIIFLAFVVFFTMLVTRMFTKEPIMIHSQNKQGFTTYFLDSGVTFHHSENAESIEDCEACFEDLDRIDVYAVLGSCFHLMQQLGGGVYLKGHSVQPASFADCSGEPLNNQTVVNKVDDNGRSDSVYLGEFL